MPSGRKVRTILLSKIDQRFILRFSSFSARFPHNMKVDRSEYINRKNNKIILKRRRFNSKQMFVQVFYRDIRCGDIRRKSTIILWVSETHVNQKVTKRHPHNVTEWIGCSLWIINKFSFVQKTFVWLFNFYLVHDSKKVARWFSPFWGNFQAKRNEAFELRIPMMDNILSTTFVQKNRTSTDQTIFEINKFSGVERQRKNCKIIELGPCHCLRKLCENWIIHPKLCYSIYH